MKGAKDIITGPDEFRQEDTDSLAGQVRAVDVSDEAQSNRPMSGRSKILTGLGLGAILMMTSPSDVERALGMNEGGMHDDEGQVAYASTGLETLEKLGTEGLTGAEVDSILDKASKNQLRPIGLGLEQNGFINIAGMAFKSRISYFGDQAAIVLQDEAGKLYLVAQGSAEDIGAMNTRAVDVVKEAQGSQKHASLVSSGRDQLAAITHQ